MMFKYEFRDLRKRIMAWWNQGLDTNQMSKIAQLPESLIERELHVVLGERQHIRESLGAKQ